MAISALIISVVLAGPRRVDGWMGEGMVDGWVDEWWMDGWMNGG